MRVCVYGRGRNAAIVVVEGGGRGVGKDGNYVLDDISGGARAERIERKGCWDEGADKKSTSARILAVFLIYTDSSLDSAFNVLISRLPARSR